METKPFLLTLYRQKQTVFRADEIAMLFPHISANALRRTIFYHISTGALLRLRRGIYAKEKFSEWEMAGKIYTPSYISLETVLARAGIIFQYYETIFAVSYLTREVECAGTKIVYKKIGKEILTNPAGIEQINNVCAASPERAFLDVVYLYKNYHFDNLEPLSWEKIFDLASIYQSKALIKKADEYYKDYKENNV